MFPLLEDVAVVGLAGKGFVATAFGEEEGDVIVVFLAADVGLGELEGLEAEPEDLAVEVFAVELLGESPLAWPQKFLALASLCCSLDMMSPTVVAEVE